MDIRRGNMSDTAQIIEFQIEMALETENHILDRSIITKDMQTVMSDDSKGWYFVAEEDEKISGSLMITFEWSDWRN